MFAFLGRLAFLIFITGSLTTLAQYYNLQSFWQQPGTVATPWHTYSPSGAPAARDEFTAVWTGSKMIVWGGKNGSSTPVNTGGLYDPVTNTWSTVTTVSAPSIRKWHTAVWTGTKMIVWGGNNTSSDLNTGGIYDPGTDSWTATTTTGAPAAREAQVAVWTGTRMIVWGGSGVYYNTGGIYDPGTDSWTATTTTGAPAGRDAPAGVWTGTKMVVWGGTNGSVMNSGGVYDPVANSWTSVTTTGAPVARAFHSMVWTGSKVLVWGGMNGGATAYNTGGLYDPNTNSWTSTTTTGAPAARWVQGSVWTGDKFFVWGGQDGGSTNLNTGGLYDPAGNSWTATSSTSAPAARFSSYMDTWMVWTGGLALFWGGLIDTNVYTYDITPPVLTLTVAKVYPTNGANWLDYVKNNNGGSNFHNQKDQACAGTESGMIQPCIHAGEKLKVQVSSLTSCKGLTASDNLDVFDWLCEDQTGSVTFYSTLRIGKGLNDLIDMSFAPGTWRTNFVSVMKGATTIGTSTPSAWWTNNIASLPSNTSTGVAEVVLSGYPAGTILTLVTNQQTSGYNVNQDKLAIVTKSDVTLTYNSRSSPNCNWTNGESDVSKGTIALICAGSQKYIWIEGNYASSGLTSTEVMLEFQNVSYSRVNKFRQYLGAYYENLYALASNYNVFTDVHISLVSGDWHPVSFENSNYNFINTLSLASEINGGYGGLAVHRNSNNNVFHNIKVSNMKDSGSSYGSIYVDQAIGNIFTRVLVTAGRGMGIGIRSVNGNTHRNTFAFVTVTNTEGYSFNVGAGDGGGTVSYNTFNNILTVNTERFKATASTNNIFSQMAFLNQDAPYISHWDASSKFTNNMLIGPATSSTCDTGGTSTGVANVSCGNADTSDANWVISASLTGASIFSGKVSSNDVTNTSDSSGTQSFASIQDWINFDNFFRAWGDDGIAFPDVSNRGDCSSGFTCRIWDWQLSNSSSLVRNRTGNGSTANNTFTADATCPTEVTGNKTLADQMSSPNTFLVNAMEILNDDIGDDDGLCESNEACIYTPNFGAYQGSGNYRTSGTCNFTNGTVKNVRLYAYPVNGA